MARKKKVVESYEKLVKRARQVGVPHPETMNGPEQIEAAIAEAEARPSVQVPSPVVEAENAVADDAPVYQ